MNMQQYPLRIPLSAQVHKTAGQFAAEQTSLAKRKQVYFNTLAVYATHRYLKWLGIETSLNQSACWNPVLRHHLDVADLVIPNVGTLECCPVLPGESAVSLSSEATEDRLGYFAIQFDDCLDQVRPLGFAREAVEGKIQLATLLPLDGLIEAVTPQPSVMTVVTSQVNGSESPGVNLATWGAGAFEQGWQALETLLSPRQLAFSVRTFDEAIERAKTLNLGLLADRKQLTLVVRRWPEADGEVGVLLEIYPMNLEEFLPPGLKVEVVLEADSDEEIAGEQDNLIRIRLTETIGKPVVVKVSLDGESISERFFV